MEKGTNWKNKGKIKMYLKMINFEKYQLNHIKIFLYVDPRQVLNI